MKTRKAVLFIFMVFTLIACMMISTFAITTATVNTQSSNLNMRSSASSSASLVTTIPKGATVTVLETVSTSDATNPEWCKVTYLSYTGYVSKKYLNNFNTVSDSTPSSSDVPAIYSSYINNLKTLHPNWTFKFYNTGLDWNEVIKNECVKGRSAISGSFPISYRSTTVNYNPSTSTTKTGVINGDDGELNYRNAEGFSNPAVGALKNGTVVTILSSNGYWYYVSVNGSNLKCYVYGGLSKKTQQYYVKDVKGGNPYTPIDGSSWYQAHGQVVRYYMDPRNFLNNDTDVFQFEKLSYDKSSHTIAGVEAILKGSFMENKSIETDDYISGSTTISGDVSGDGKFSLADAKVTLKYCTGSVELTSEQIKNGDFDGDGKISLSDAKKSLYYIVNNQTPSSVTQGHYRTVTYAQAIMEAAEKTGVSPYHLASRIIQEVGNNGSKATSGQDATYPGIYNFYNIQATAGADPAANGLNWASQSGDYGRPWTSPYKSIVNGAAWIANGYINVGQDTLYFQKFSVVNSSKLYWHQYMSNVGAPSSEGKEIHDSYNKLGIVNNNFVFVIPVYNNMPSAVCQLPASSSSPNLTPDY